MINHLVEYQTEYCKHFRCFAYVKCYYIKGFTM